jgi:hypothetical protein
MGQRALGQGLVGRARSGSRDGVELTMRRYGAATTQSNSEAAAVSRWLSVNGRGCGLLERSGDAADAERAGQKLHELQRAATV